MLRARWLLCLTLFASTAGLAQTPSISAPPLISAPEQAEDAASPEEVPPGDESIPSADEGDAPRMPAAARISLEAMGGAAAGTLAGLMALGASELLFDDCADNPICISIFLMRSSRTSRGSTTHFTSASSSGSRSSTPSRRLASLWSNSSTPLRAAWCSTGSWPSSGWMVDIINRHYGRWFNRIYDMDAAALANAERAALGEAVQLKALLSP